MSEATPALVAETARLKDNPRTEAEARAQLGKPDPRDSDPSKEGVFQDHNCWRCKDGQLPCVKGKGNERHCDTLHARND